MLRLLFVAGVATLATAAEPAIGLPVMPPLTAPPITLPAGLPTVPPVPSAEEMAKQLADANQKAADAAQKVAEQAASAMGLATTPPPLSNGIAQAAPDVPAPPEETEVSKSSSTETDSAPVKDAATGEETGDLGLENDATTEAQEDAAESLKEVQHSANKAKDVAATEDDDEFDSDGGPTKAQFRKKSQLDFMEGTFLYPAVKIVASIKTFIIPIIALALGGGMMVAAPSDAIAMVGKLVLYFGAQSFMNIFMSWVLHLKITIFAGTEIERMVITGEETKYETFILEKDLTGCPAGFALTAMQQVISFVLFMIFFVVMMAAGKPYQPKRLETLFEWVSVVIFGCVFAANIALNNFSLAYISIGVNLIIRSCLPLTTYVSQQVLAQFGLYKKKQCSTMHALEVVLMAFGVTCAAIFVWASFEGKLLASDSGGSSRLIGVVGCIASLLCGSVNLALAGVLGETKLNVLDTVAYMAIPACLFLAPIIFLIPKPIPGPWAPLAGTIDGEVRRMTDWQVLATTFTYSKSTIAWLVVSGFFSFMYNLVQFNIVHTLSPSATAFGGNFNKAALTFMTLLLPFLHTKTPKWPYIMIEWIALIVNIMAFSGYSVLTIMGKQAEAKSKEELLSASSEDEVESGSGSE